MFIDKEREREKRQIKYNISKSNKKWKKKQKYKTYKKKQGKTIANCKSKFKLSTLNIFVVVFLNVDLWHNL